ncbi:class I SAM-dependent methyltransferase [Nocardioides marmoribigeumensis]|uniref:O-methyltransferase involved in polyketide biosynthesis n=1 Tax=Nocardioides marmoribigeumensis TaxID=433649 RepID=A0ABU2BWZ6_9ACTN|nr:class I SAM-dependent methyltransferase [Nocardioides marmoribigeumensis]MDR7362599.1 O-methyltransferase involved in polyketide biosynthesis [Nocardioides marmoribigeumensis]
MSWVRQWFSGGSSAISPTAHYTGFVWARHGLGDPDLATGPGRLLFTAGQGLLAPLDRLGGPTLEHFLLARHRILDHLLEEAIASGEVGQVVELAAGLSPRGLELTRRHPGLTYVEVDLPAMATRKAEVLRGKGVDPGRHRATSADVLDDEAFAAVFSGPSSLLDPSRGTAVVTEGLLNYFPREAVLGLWRRTARELSAFPTGRYYSDLHVASRTGLVDRAFIAGLGAFVRGQVHLHFADEAEAESALRGAGFARARLVAPRELARTLPDMEGAGADRVRVVEAST